MGAIARITRGTAALGLCAAGCAFVELTTEGGGVRVASPELLAECQPLGKTTVTTRDRVLWQRNEEKVSAELEILARNSGARMGGNAVAPAGKVVEGRRVYEVYRCGRGPQLETPSRLR